MDSSNSSSSTVLPLELELLLKMRYGIWDVFKFDYSINQVNGMNGFTACMYNASIYYCCK